MAWEAAGGGTEGLGATVRVSVPRRAGLRAHGVQIQPRVSPAWQRGGSWTPRWTVPELSALSQSGNLSDGEGPGSGGPAQGRNTCSAGAVLLGPPATETTSMGLGHSW